MGPREAAAEVLAALLPTLPQAAANRPELSVRSPDLPGLPEGREGREGHEPLESRHAAIAIESDGEAVRLAAKDPARSSMPADQRLREFLRGQPGLGKRDRLLVADLVFDVLRNLRLYQELAHASGRSRLAPAERPRVLVEIALAVAHGAAANGCGADINGSADSNSNSSSGEGASPSPWSSIAAGLPQAVRYSLPDWLWERLEATHGARTGAIAAALLHPSPIDIRVNLLLGKANELRALLAQRGIDTAAIQGVPTGLRVIGRPNLEHLDLFQQGWFEIQDAGSQWIVDGCGVKRGQLVIDFCAGGGGKSLAIAARMRNLGKVLAFDTVEERLARLSPRAVRAGTDIVEPMRIDGLADRRLGRYRSRADVVLVDAPCSGTGTLRRSPDLKWRLSPARLQAHVEEQQAILRAAAPLVKPGGMLVYATCSLLREENELQVARFEQAGFNRMRMAAWLPDEGPSSSFFLATWVFQARR